MRRIVWLAGAALVVIVFAGFVECIVTTACIKDPCWWNCLHCGVGATNNASVAALLAIVVTVIGFETWKAQLAGTARHEAARMVLSTMKTLGEGIADARRGLVLVKEVRRGAHFIGGPPTHLKGKNPQHVAQFYGAPVWEAKDRLRAAEADAVAVIGWEARERLAPVFRTVDEFLRQFAVQWDGNITPEEGEDRRQNAAMWGMKPDALYSSAKDDEYAKMLTDAFAAADDYFRQFVEPTHSKGRRG